MNALFAQLAMEVFRAYVAKNHGETVASQALSITAEVAKAYAKAKQALAAEGKDLDAMLEAMAAENDRSIFDVLDIK